MKLIYYLLVILSLSSPLLAQTASLRGQVTDSTGAVIPGAQVALSGPSGLVNTTTTAGDGSYSFAGLPPGSYTVQASAPELALPRPLKVTLRPGLRTLNLQLKVASTTQQVTVEENAGPTVTPEPANNASALDLTGEDLQALADNPEDLQADLEALAGPSAGPGGGSIYIDGFSSGEIPPKESIREIRINQNPFSPEYDRPGYGRIEIFTKPGSDKFHGTAYYNIGDSVWNSRDPYAAQKAPFLLQEMGGNLSGPLNKRASFFLDLQRAAIDTGSIINAITLDPQTLAIVSPFTGVLRVPQRRFIISPRVDYQLTPGHTLSLRYMTRRTDVQDAGIGNFNLVSRGYHTHYDSQMARIADTAVLGSSIINESRFQFFRLSGSTIANSSDPAIQVLGSFNGGGAQVGHSLDTQNNYEFHNYTSINHGAHAWRFGVRLRGETNDTISPQNFGGSFTFGGGLAPQLDSNNQPVLDASGQPVLAPITSIERYRRTLLFQQLGLPAAQIRALGGGATQFSLNAGLPGLAASQVDVGAFVGDDWRARPGLTLSLGLRYETQSNIHDWRDFAPRLGVAWAPGGKGGKSKNVIRGGFGIFYDRFPLGDTLTALRYNGIVQQQYVVTNPDFFPLIPPVSALAGSQSVQSIQQVSSTLRAPYIMQSSAGFERQLPRHTTLAVTYANSHGLHLLRSNDINAPLPGTYNPLVPAGAVFPHPGEGPILLMESSGLYNQNQLITNVNSRLNQKISLFGSYVYNHAMSNTDGLGTFPADPYSFAGEYAPASTDVRHRFTMGGSILTKWNVRLSPLLIVSSGPPFDVTVGRDLYGDTLFNGRPGIATDPNKPGLIPTPYGLLDPNPTPDERILPRNF
ncbi:MAG TPA: carboxypeptidase-like regulatory domain-containing protein, partial [Bryobacterales bacterium]|nr:carboxypeptidase-like regulatory domain-containing protein [Bryobacterales bacterium]